MRRRLALSFIAGPLLMLTLSISDASAGGGSFVVGDVLGDGELGGAVAAIVAWTGTAWPEPGPADFSLNAFCSDAEFFVSGDTGFDTRIVWEFPLDELPTGATITSAILTVQSSGGPTGGLLVSGFAGNGAIDLSDGAGGGSSIPFPGVPFSTNAAWDVTSQMSAAMAASGWAGFTVQGSFDRTVHGADGYATVHRLVCPQQQQGPPTLTIAYDLAPPASNLPNAATPEPGPTSDLAILGFGLLLIGSMGALAVASARVRTR
jgi:hypothetical protein